MHITREDKKKPITELNITVIKLLSKPSVHLNIIITKKTKVESYYWF